MKPPTIETILQKLVSEIRDPADLESGYDRLKPELHQAIEDDERLTAVEKQPLKSILAGPYKRRSTGEPAPHRLLHSLASSLESKKSSQAVPTKYEQAIPDGPGSMTFEEASRFFKLVQLPIAYGIQCYVGAETIVNIPFKIGNRLVVSICDKAFSDCSEIEEVFIPSSVMKVGIEAFRDCSNLRKVILPDSLHTLGSKAFAGCEKLSEINLPSGLQQCGGHLFEGCSELRSILIPNTFRKLGNALAGCSGITEVEIPESVTEIGVGAFKNCNSLERVRIPDSVTRIRLGAFDGCNNLRHLELPSSLEDFGNPSTPDDRLRYLMGDKAFSKLNSLEQVTVRFSKNAPEWVGGEAFFNCRGLRTIMVQGEVDRLRESFFEGFSRVVDIRILAPVTVINDGAFKHCSSLERIEIPDTVIKMGLEAFEGCTKLRELLIGPENPAFMFREGVLFDNIMSKLLFCVRTKEGGYSIPDCVEEVCSKAFAACWKLQSVTIPNTVERVAEDAFDGFQTIRTENPDGSILVELTRLMKSPRELGAEDEFPISLADLIAENLDD